MLKHYIYKILIFLRLKKKKKKSPYDFIDIGYNFADSFKDLVFSENINLRIQKLKNGLDLASCQIIDEVVEKLVCLIPRSTQKVLIDKKTLFSDRDLALQDKILKDSSWNGYPLSNYFMSEVYYFHNGIKLLSQQYINRYIVNKIVVDVGAANGDSAFCFAKYNPMQILSFEPNIDTFKILQQNILSYNLPAKAFNLALSNHNEAIFATLDSVIAINGGGGGNYGNNTNVTAKDSKLHIGLIKMDIEGEEQNALIGAKGTIMQHKPILLIAIYHHAEQFFGIKNLIESWDIGYSFRIVKLSVFHPTDEIILMALPKDING